jgi:hypothetical protein
MSKALRGVCSAVFRTTVLPQASAGATFQAEIRKWFEWGDTEHGERKVPRDDLAADTEWFMHGILDSVWQHR